jgi:hypothetical protein
MRSKGDLPDVPHAGRARAGFYPSSRPRVPDHTFSAERPRRRGPDRQRPCAPRDQDQVGRFVAVSAVVTNTGWGHSLPTGNDQEHGHRPDPRLDGGRGHRLGKRSVHRMEQLGVRDHPPGRGGDLAGTRMGQPGPSEPPHQARARAPRRATAFRSPTTRPYHIEAQLLFRRGRPSTLEAYDLDESIYGTERLLTEACPRALAVFAEDLLRTSARRIHPGLGGRIHSQDSRPHRRHTLAERADLVRSVADVVRPSSRSSSARRSSSPGRLAVADADLPHRFERHLSSPQF